MRSYINSARFPETVHFCRIDGGMIHEPNPRVNDQHGGHFVGRWIDGTTFENFDGERLIFPALNAAGLRIGAINWAEQ